MARLAPATSEPFTVMRVGGKCWDARRNGGSYCVRTQGSARFPGLLCLAARTFLLASALTCEHQFLSTRGVSLLFWA